MITTINISLPEQMYKDAKKVQKKDRYTSVSELIRDALRKRLYEGITANGFTPEFEEQVLAAASEPDLDDVWETEKDVRNYFLNLRRQSKRK